MFKQLGFHFQRATGAVKDFHAQRPGAAAAVWLTIAIGVVGPLEGLFLHPYYDVAHVKTVCYGATASDGVDLNRTYTKEECDKMLGTDLAKYDAQIQACLPKGALKYYLDADYPHRRAAYVSFGYNLGVGDVCHTAVGRYLAQGNIKASCDAMLPYDRARVNGVLRPVAGLTKRRREEHAMCLMKG